MLAPRDGSYLLPCRRARPFRGAADAEEPDEDTRNPRLPSPCSPLVSVSSTPDFSKYLRNCSRFESAA